MAQWKVTVAFLFLVSFLHFWAKSFEGLGNMHSCYMLPVFWS